MSNPPRASAQSGNRFVVAGCIFGFLLLAAAFALALNIDKVRERLGWRPVWDFERTVAEPASWYKAWLGSDRPVRDLCREQIDRYEGDAAALGVPWTG